MSIYELLPYAGLLSIALTFLAMAFARFVWNRFIRPEPEPTIRELILIARAYERSHPDFEAERFHEERGDV